MTPNQVTITKILHRGEDFVTSLHNISRARDLFYPFAGVVMPCILVWGSAEARPSHPSRQ